MPTFTKFIPVYRDYLFMPYRTFFISKRGNIREASSRRTTRQTVRKTVDRVIDQTWFSIRKETSRFDFSSPAKHESFPWGHLITIRWEGSAFVFCTHLSCLGIIKICRGGGNKLNKCTCPCCLVLRCFNLSYLPLRSKKEDKT